MKIHPRSTLFYHKEGTFKTGKEIRATEAKFDSRIEFIVKNKAKIFGRIKTLYACLKSNFVTRTYPF